MVANKVYKEFKNKWIHGNHGEVVYLYKVDGKLHVSRLDDSVVFDGDEIYSLECETDTDEYWAAEGWAQSYVDIYPEVKNYDEIITRTGEVIPACEAFVIEDTGEIISGKEVIENWIENAELEDVWCEIWWEIEAPAV